MFPVKWNKLQLSQWEINFGFGAETVLLLKGGRERIFVFLLYRNTGWSEGIRSWSNETSTFASSRRRRSREKEGKMGEHFPIARCDTRKRTIFLHHKHPVLTVHMTPTQQHAGIHCAESANERGKCSSRVQKDEFSDVEGKSLSENRCFGGGMEKVLKLRPSKSPNRKQTRQQLPFTTTLFTFLDADSIAFDSAGKEMTIN